MSPSFGVALRADMAEQHSAVAEMFARRDDLAQQLARIVDGPPAGIVFVARGSSDHAALFGRYLFDIVVGRPVVLAAPSVYTRYAAHPDLHGWLAVAISQSGETPEIVSTVDLMRGCGARTIAITNDADSALAAAVDLTVELRCGVERAVPATKTVTTSLAALTVLARALASGDVPWTVDDEHRATDSIGLVMADETVDVYAAADRCLQAAVVTNLGRGFTLAAASEGALKLREMTGRKAEAMSAADYLHGPIAAAHADTAVITYAAPGPVLADVVDAAHNARSRGARLVWVAPASSVPKDGSVNGDVHVPVPRLCEELVALPMIVRGQQIAYAAALGASADPDQPWGLTKVTATT